MRKLISVLVLFITLGASAQVDQKAKTILDQVSAKTQSYPSITADFTFKLENQAAKVSETSKGSVIIQGSKYLLNLSGIEIISDGKTTWTYIKDANEVSISDANSDENSTINPAKIFTIYNQGFKNNYLGEFTSNNKLVHRIELIPTTMKEFKKVNIEIEKATSQISGAIIYSTDNNQYTISLSNMTTTKKYPDTTFTFNKAKYPNAEVVDMR